ncbi:MAG: hypothetical protein ABSF28_24150 [Terracidiphilus sp.]
MEVLDSSIANVALPRISGDLGATNSEITWHLSFAQSVIGRVQLQPVTSITELTACRRYISGQS